MRSSISISVFACVVACAGSSVVACGSAPRFALHAHETNDAEGFEVGERKLPPFLLFADTQYSIPVTDYDVVYGFGEVECTLPPNITSNAVGSFYRHAAANLTLPDVVTDILQKREGGPEFALFGGDLVEFACQSEADTMFEALDRGGIPVAIAPGNHDVLFHGSYDTDGIDRDGTGPWDRYAQALWSHVCRDANGPLTKSRFIERTLRYYAGAFGFPREQLGLSENLSPRWGGSFEGTAVSSDEKWTLKLAYRVSTAEDLMAHRKSHLWQRFIREGGDGEDDVVITVLDTTDYGDSAGLCAASGIIQVGMGGVISADQVEWIEKLGTASGAHFVLSHYVPFEKVAGESRCETTAGTACDFARLAKSEAFNRATFVYAHVHKDLLQEVLTDRRDPAIQHLFVRLPSLVDNKSYAIAKNRKLTPHPVWPGDNGPMSSQKPFSQVDDTCEQRHREIHEFKHNLACFQAQGRCATDLAASLHAEKANIERACKEAPRDWRNRLRDEARNALEAARLTDEQRVQFARQALQATETKAAKSGGMVGVQRLLEKVIHEQCGVSETSRPRR